MPPVLSHLSAVIALAALSAWTLAFGLGRQRPVPLYRHVAWLLTWVLASGLARAALQAWVTRPARVVLGDQPYRWPEVMAYHLDEALHLTGPVALVAAGLAVFVRRRPWWPIVATVVALGGAFAGVYPTLRGVPRSLGHAAVATAAVAVVATAGWVSLARRRDRWGAEHVALVLLASTELAVAIVVGWWPDPREHWEIARRVQLVAFALLLFGQLWQIRRRRWETT